MFKVVHVDDSTKWIAYTTVKTEASKLPGTDISKQIVQAVKQRVDKFFPCADGAELIFGPGFSLVEKSQIRSYAESKKLVYVDRFHSGSSYFSISKAIDVRTVAFHLKTKTPGEVYCRYSFIKNEDIPKTSETGGPVYAVM